ncbi:MAG: PKD domain-containing protein, partial [Bacteroidales bacterium]|nr:PKD domain-containing protein [Bacteroidales bacterium]
ILKNETTVVDRDLAIELLFKSQSVKKYPIHNYDENQLPYYVNTDDIIEKNRNPLFFSGPYTSYVPYATKSSWNNAFIFDGAPIGPAAGIDKEYYRAKRYADVLLDCILQPDMSAEFQEDIDLLNDLSYMADLGTAGAGITLSQIITGSPNVIISSTEIQTTLNTYSSTVKNLHILHFFQKLGIAISGVTYAFNLRADAAQLLYLQVLANAKAKERLIALKTWIYSCQDLDPALVSGIQLAEEKFNDYIDSEYYSDLEAIFYASLQYSNVIDLALLTGQIAAHFSSAAIASVILPYYLSWQTWKLIRDQTQSAQHCVIAATLREEILNSDFLTSLKNQVNININLQDANNIVHLTNISLYLGYYFYNRFYDISTNFLYSFYNTISEMINLGNWSNYNEFKAYLKSMENYNLEGFYYTNAPFYLGENWAGMDPTASDDERGFLLSKLIGYIPDLIEPTLLSASFDLIYSSTEPPVNCDFQDLSEGNIINWEWSFGDGSYFAGQYPPTHVYNSGGTYIISLTISDGTYTDTYQKTLNLQYQETVSMLEANIFSGAAPLIVQFNNLSTGNNLSYLWGFGDGNTSNIENPEHIYSTPGIYSVSLAAAGIGGQDVLTISDYIEVQGPTGDIEVITNNQDAAFNISGSSVHTGAGLLVLYEDVPVGEYTINFSEILGYQTPESVTAILNQNSILTFSANYIGNNNPTLEWVGDQYYETDGINPEIGESQTDFTYRVIYRDIDGDPPDFGYPLLHILKEGEEIFGSPFQMTEENSNPINEGRIYSIEINELEIIGSYSYFFEARDENELTATGTPTIVKYGPEIYPVSQPYSIFIKAFLEGPFDTISDLMNTQLYPDLIPINQPFCEDPWNYCGNENVSEIPANIVDWILVELRDASSVIYANNATILARKAAFLNENGNIVDLDGVSPLVFDYIIYEDLFVVIRHRNHLGIISSIALLNTEGTYFYNFSDNSYKSLGGQFGIKEIESGVWVMIGGDGNSDNLIDQLDKSNSWSFDVGKSGYLKSDFNMNRQVDNKDKIDNWLPNINKSSQVPD